MAEANATFSAGNASLYRVLRPFLITLFKLWYNPTIEGKLFIPEEGAAVIAGNHKHALDPVFVYASTKRTVRTLAKKELFKGVFGRFFHAIGSIPTDTDAEHNPDAFSVALEKLKEGNLINISPEAGRNYTSEVLLPFKYGAVVLTKRADCKLVPYAVTGDYKFRSKNLKITFIEPLDIKDLDIEDSNVLLFNTIKDLLAKD